MKWALFATGWVAACSTAPEYAESLVEAIACGAVAVTCFASAAWVAAKASHDDA